ncbi:hypothetical protein DMENIID0001_119620 [Sergentomyia squamirostris]
MAAAALLVSFVTCNRAIINKFSADIVTDSMKRESEEGVPSGSRRKTDKSMEKTLAAVTLQRDIHPWLCTQNFLPKIGRGITVMVEFPPGMVSVCAHSPKRAITHTIYSTTIAISEPPKQ